MSRAAGQRLAALLSQRHFRASGVGQKSKRGAPPPPVYDSSTAHHGHPSNGPKKSTTNSQAGGAAASSQNAASDSKAGAAAATAAHNKPVLKPETGAGLVRPPLQAASKPTQSDSSQVGKGSPPSGGPVTHATPSQPAKHVSPGTAPAQPVQAAAGLSATQAEGAEAGRPASPALDPAGTYGSKAEVSPSPVSGTTSAASSGPAGSRAPQQYYTGPSAVKQAASGSGIGSSAAGKPPQGNAWLLSRSVPVDVRLLAAGAASLGALYYYSSRDTRKPPGSEEPKQLPEESEMGFVPPARPQHDSPEASEEAALQQWEMLASEEGERSSSAEQAADEDDAPETAEAAVETMQDAKAEAPAPSDPAPVEAPSGSFSSPGDFYTDELAMDSRQSPSSTTAGQELESSAWPGEETPRTSESKEQSKLAQTLQDGISSAAKAVEHSIKHGQPLDFVDTRPVADLLNEVGHGDLSTLDPSMPGGFDQERAEHRVDAAHAEVDALKGTMHVPKSGDHTLEDLLGIDEDLGAEALLLRAIERGEGDSSDWHASKESLIQARSDEKTIQEVLGKIYAKQQGRLSAALAVAEANADRAEQIEREAAEAQLQFAKILEETLRASERQREHDMKQQEALLASAAAEHAAQERLERLEELDRVRRHVNALGAAFSRRSDEAQASTLAHQLSLGLFALEDALTHGRPYAAAASQVARCAPDDELVASACRALPEGPAKKGIPTYPELLKRATALEKTVRQMAYLEPNRGGLASLALARLAAGLKISESVAGQQDKQSGSVDGALACLQDSLARGNLGQAAAAIEAGTKGTAAYGVARAWAQDARARALADQTASLLQAHACSLAASQA